MRRPLQLRPKRSDYLWMFALDLDERIREKKMTNLKNGSRSSDARDVSVAGIDMKLEVIVIPVSDVERWKRPLTTTIEPTSTWYSAEDYHRDYLRKHPEGYSCHYMAV